MSEAGRLFFTDVQMIMLSDYPEHVRVILQMSS
jgi:hypothetical protein